MDYYNILGVSKNASAEEIKRAYKKMVAKKHPDRHGNTPEAEKEFQNIRKAYDTLSDSNKRKMYDQYGSDWEKRSQTSGFNGDFSNWGSDFFSSMFGGFGGMSQREARGDDIEVYLPITIIDAANGVDKKIDVARYKKCSTCNGLGAPSRSDISSCANCKGTGQSHQSMGGMIFASTCSSCGGSGKRITKSCSNCMGKGISYVRDFIDVTVPKGMPFGKSIKKTGMGNAIRDGLSGDLYIRVQYKDDPSIPYKIVVGSNNLYMDMNIDIADAIFGVEHEVKSVMRGEDKVVISIPAGIDSGKKIVVSNAGMPALGGSRRGDIICTVNVKTPKNLSSKHKAMIKEVKDEGGFSLGNKKSWKSYIFGS